MSAEKLVKRQLRRMVFWRFVGDVIGVPRRLLEALAGIVRQFEDCVFYFEADAARQYEKLTDVDLGRASGDGTRYMGLREDQFAKFFDGEEEA